MVVPVEQARAAHHSLTKPPEVAVVVVAVLVLQAAMEQLVQVLALT